MCKQVKNKKIKIQDWILFNNVCTSRHTSIGRGNQFAILKEAIIILKLSNPKILVS